MPYSDDITVPRPQREVWDFLRDLRTHWQLSERFEPLAVEFGDDGETRGAQVRVRGPFGVTRMVQTAVQSVVEPELLTGTAVAGDGARGEVRWELRAEGEAATHVTLTVTPLDLPARDALALRVGGGVWLRRELGKLLRELRDRLG